MLVLSRKLGEKIHDRGPDRLDGRQGRSESGPPGDRGASTSISGLSRGDRSDAGEAGIGRRKSGAPDRGDTRRAFGPGGSAWPDRPETSGHNHGVDRPPRVGSPMQRPRNVPRGSAVDRSVVAPGRQRRQDRRADLLSTAPLSPGSPRSASSMSPRLRCGRVAGREVGDVDPWRWCTDPPGQRTSSRRLASAAWRWNVSTRMTDGSDRSRESERPEDRPDRSPSLVMNRGVRPVRDDARAPITSSPSRQCHARLRISAIAPRRSTWSREGPVASGSGALETFRDLGA